MGTAAWNTLCILKRRFAVLSFDRFTIKAQEVIKAAYDIVTHINFCRNISAFVTVKKPMFCIFTW